MLYLSCYSLSATSIALITNSKLLNQMMKRAALATVKRKPTEHSICLWKSKTVSKQDRTSAALLISAASLTWKLNTSTTHRVLLPTKETVMFTPIQSRISKSRSIDPITTSKRKLLTEKKCDSLFRMNESLFSDTERALILEQMDKVRIWPFLNTWVDFRNSSERKLSILVYFSNLNPTYHLSLYFKSILI